MYQVMDVVGDRSPALLLLLLLLLLVVVAVG